MACYTMSDDKTAKIGLVYTPDEERGNDSNYDTIMRDNLELIKKELYQ